MLEDSIFFPGMSYHNLPFVENKFEGTLIMRTSLSYAGGFFRADQCYVNHNETYCRQHFFLKPGSH